MSTVAAVDLGRRRFLTATATVVGGVGAAFVAVPFLKSWSPSERAKAAGAPVEADISKLEDGAMMTVEWRGKPVWVVKRTPKMLSDLATLNDQLTDPRSEMASQQPKYTQNANRSIKPEVLVLVGICTHLGCIPKGQGISDVRGDFNGWFCVCHGSHYDTAGRIRRGPAPRNLDVPVYEFATDTMIKIG